MKDTDKEKNTDKEKTIRKCDSKVRTIQSKYCLLTCNTFFTKI